MFVSRTAVSVKGKLLMLSALPNLIGSEMLIAENALEVKSPITPSLRSSDERHRRKNSLDPFQIPAWPGSGPRIERLDSSTIHVAGNR